LLYAAAAVASNFAHTKHASKATAIACAKLQQFLQRVSREVIMVQTQLPISPQMLPGPTSPQFNCKPLPFFFTAHSLMQTTEHAT